MNSQKELPGRHFLISLAQTATQEIVQNNPVLDTTQQGKLSIEHWRIFSEQRYRAALSFESLLQAGINSSHALGDEALAKALEDNLKDELGLDAQGVTHPQQSHATWRRDFYHALGVDEAGLGDVNPLEGTRAYSDTIESLVRQGDALAIAGALLVLEASIPTEFSKIKEGRDQSFPERFVDLPTDSADVRRTKSKARMYIDDHIVHDASSHYPQLLKALEKHAGSTKADKRIRQGVVDITKAKMSFYDSLAKRLAL